MFNIVMLVVIALGLLALGVLALGALALPVWLVLGVRDAFRPAPAEPQADA